MAQHFHAHKRGAGQWFAPLLAPAPFLAAKTPQPQPRLPSAAQPCDQQPSQSRRWMPALWLACAISLAAPTGAAASGQGTPPAPRGSVAHFLARAEPLMRLGPLALASPEASRLKAEVVHIARLYKSRNDAQRRGGQPRKSCPPASGDMEPEQWLDHLRSYPAPSRAYISLSTAFEQLMEKHFPCPAR